MDVPMNCPVCGDSIIVIQSEEVGMIGPVPPVGGMWVIEAECEREHRFQIVFTMHQTGTRITTSPLSSVEFERSILNPSSPITG